MLASRGIILKASISLERLFGIEVLSRRPSPSKILVSGEEREVFLFCVA